MIFTDSLDTASTVASRKKLKLFPLATIDMNEDTLAELNIKSRASNFGFSTEAKIYYPQSSVKAYSSTEAEKWIDAEKSEYLNLYRNYNAFEFVDTVPDDQVVYPLKVAYKTKYKANGAFEKRKVRCTVAETDRN